MEKGVYGSAYADLLNEVSGRLGQNSGDEDGLSTPSNYSSCGSELERYCSANSVLGAVSSTCSSIANRGELLDNLRSLGLGDELEIIGGRQKLQRRSLTGNPIDFGRSEWLSDGTIDSPRENCLLDSPVFSGRTDGLRRNRMDTRHSMGRNGNRGGDVIGVNTEGRKTIVSYVRGNGNLDRDSNENGVACMPRVITSGHENHINSDARRGVGLDGDVADGYGGSDGEDSGLDSGTDDEDRVRLIERHDLQTFRNAKIHDKGNPLLMNATAAFGYNDWEDFMLENEGAGSASDPLFQLETSEQAQKSLRFGGDSCNQEGFDIKDNTVTASATARLAVHEKSEAIKGHPIEDPPELSIQKDYVQETVFHEQAVDELDRARSNQNLMEYYHGKDAQTVHSGAISSHNQNAADVVEVGESHFPPVDITSKGKFDFNDLSVNNVEVSMDILSLTLDSNHDFDINDKDIASDKANGHDAKELFEEMVLDMEEILLESGESHQGKLAQAVYMSQHFNYRDGSSTASTSDANDAYALYQHPFRIERIEVIGAKQKKGDVSFGDRLVGIKEYTVYRLRVWSGKDQWEVEHRYREFFSLYRQLKALFKGHDLVLPSPWNRVESDSRKVFGNSSPNVVKERSSLIQDCLQSILTAKTPFGIPTSLVLFLSPGKGNNSSSSSSVHPQSLQTLADDAKSTSSHYSDNNHMEEVTMLGKKISLVVELKIPKSTRQLLEEQRYMCAGCHRHLDTGKSIMEELVKTIGWGKPRLCEYTGQLFCSSCHVSDTAILPARVLHNWDFSLYPISQLAKAYLESIYDKPMLCVSAVNPFLFSKVPALHHIMGIRRKIGAMTPYIRCPFRRSIQRGLGSRMYLLESNDFFALRDLVDLSKGPFAALPVVVEAVSTKILEHITQQCLICYDIGAPCAAKQACRDPASAILPFQESEAVRCSLCSAIFHEPCIRFLGGCPCSKPVNINTDETAATPSSGYEESDEPNRLSLHMTDSKAQTTGFLYNFFSKATPEKLWKQKNNNPVILMSSLPNSSL